MPGKHRKAQAPPPPAAVPAPSAGAFPWRETVVAAGCLIVAGVVAYYPSFRGVFLLDDFADITENHKIHYLWPIWDFLREPYNISRPVVIVTLAANYVLGGEKTWGYHLVNLCVHIACALTLFGVVRRTLLTERLRARFGAHAAAVALVAALVWLLHPLETQGVTYIIQRFESMMALFYLLALYCFIRGYGPPRRVGWDAAAVACCMLGMACKQVMVTAPLALLLYDLVFLSRGLEGVRKRWALYAWIAGSWVFLIVLLKLSPPLTFGGFDLRAFTMDEYARSQPGVVLHYLRLALWPDDLCLDYTWQVAQPGLGIWLPSLVLSGLLLATLVALWRAPAWGFCAASYFLILVPTSSLMAINDLAFEHRAYLPMAALVPAVVCSAYLLGRWLLGRFIADEVERRRAGALAACAVVGVLSAALAWRTYRRNEDYQSTYRMWQMIAEQRPNNPRARLHLANAMASDGRREAAMRLYEAALALKPDFADAETNLGNQLAALGRHEEGIEHFKRALKIDPAHVAAQNNLAVSLAALGKPEDAIKYYEEVLKASPRQIEAHNNLGLLLAERGRSAEAVEHYQEAIKLKPDFALAQCNLGSALARLGRYDEGRRHCEKAIELKPDLATAYNNLGLCLAGLGKYDEALVQYDAAMARAEGYADAHNNKGAALAALGRSQEAVAEYEAALAVNPKQADVHSNLGLAFQSLNRRAEAMKQFEAALELKPDYPEAHNNLGICLALDGKLDDALRHCQAALKARPNYADAFNNCGLILAGQGKLEDALRYYHDALNTKPDMVKTYTNIGNVYIAQGKWKEAEEQYRTRLQLTPDDPEAHMDLGNALDKQGRAADAEAAFARALALRPGFKEAQERLDKLKGAVKKGD